jgi:hypothetical protein
VKASTLLTMMKVAPQLCGEPIEPRQLADVGAHRHEFDADAHTGPVVRTAPVMQAADVLDDLGQRGAGAHAAEGLGGGAVDAHHELIEAGPQQAAGQRVVEQQRIGGDLGAQAARLGESHHVEKARVQQRLAETHEGDGAGGVPIARRHIRKPVHDGRERRPLHEPFGLVPGAAHAGRTVQIAGVGGLDVGLAKDIRRLRRRRPVTGRGLHFRPLQRHDAFTPAATQAGRQSS